MRMWNSLEIRRWQRMKRDIVNAEHHSIIDLKVRVLLSVSKTVKARIDDSFQMTFILYSKHANAQTLLHSEEPIQFVDPSFLKKWVLSSSLTPLVEKTEQKRRKKFSVCSVFYVRNGRHVRFVRYDRFQMKEIVGMFGLECKKASVCSVFKHKKSSVCSVLNARNCRIYPLGKLIFLFIMQSNVTIAFFLHEFQTYVSKKRSGKLCKTPENFSLARWPN